MTLSYPQLYAWLMTASVITVMIVGLSMWTMNRPAILLLEGIPKPVQAHIGQIEDDYADAVGRHFISLLMNWSEGNRGARMTEAARMLSPSMRDKFRNWITKYFAVLEWFGKNQIFRVDSTTTQLVADSRWEVQARGRIVSSYGGLGEEYKEITVTVLLEQIEPRTNSPYLLQVIGLSVPNLQ